MIAIHKAEKGDISGIKRLLGVTSIDTDGEFFSEKAIKNIADIWHTDKFLESQISDANTRFLIAKNGNEEIVSMITAICQHKNIFLRRLYVHPKHQRHGIGSSLIKEIINAFPGCKKILAEVEEKNLKGVNFYLKEGFRKVSSKRKEIEGTILEIAALERDLS